MNKLFTKNFKCACYFYLILLISAVRETFIRQKDSENDAIDRAWKNKNEEILRHTFLKRLKYLPLTFGFTALLVISVSQQPTNLLIAIIRMINLSSLVMIFGIAPMVFLWKIGKFPSFLHYLVSKEYLEASQGDMKESNFLLIEQGCPQWKVKLISFQQIFILVFLSSYYRTQDLILSIGSKIISR